MVEEELLVTLSRGDSGGGAGFGFSLLGSNTTAVLRGHHVIYDIVENSPAARSGKIEQSTAQSSEALSGQPHFQGMK